MGVLGKLGGSLQLLEVEAYLEVAYQGVACQVEVVHIQEFVPNGDDAVEYQKVQLQNMACGNHWNLWLVWVHYC